MITKEIISFLDLSTWKEAEVHQNVTKLTVSYTMDEASQITVQILDPGFEMLTNNYFQIRRLIQYRGRLFEIAALEVGTADGATPMVTVEARSGPIQLMKRDKVPESFRGISATEFAQTIASRYNLKFFGEQTPKKQSIVKSRSSNADESVWDVLTRAASDAQFVCFESDGTLFFCSQRFLLGRISSGNTSGLTGIYGPEYPGEPIKKNSTGNVVGLIQGIVGVLVDEVYGVATEAAVKAFQTANGLSATGIVEVNTWNKMFRSIQAKQTYTPMRWPTPSTERNFIVMQQPSVRRSDDDPFEGDGSLSVDRVNGVKLRAGQTIGLIGIPQFEGLYLITETRFDEASPDPVEISFRTPATPEKPR